MKFGFRKKGSRGFSLFELVMTLAVLSVMILAAVPLLQNSIRRQKEQDLRQALRDVRFAIDEFKRDAAGACPGNVAGQNIPGRITGQQNISPDPRSRVIIDDCKLFTTDNLDRYPPTLEDLVNGVRVKSRTPDLGGVSGGGKSIFDQPNATDINSNESELTKVYLRKLPIDPMTGKDDWNIRSSYQDKDSTDWDKVNVFDIRSSSDAEAMNGEKYSDW